MTAVWVDGALVSSEAASVSILDRGVLYGESAFERMRAYGGRVLGLPLRLDLLTATAAALGMSIDRAAVEADVARALAHADADVALRALVTAGDPARGLSGRRLVVVEPPGAPPQEAYASGVSVVTVHTDHSPLAPLGSHKWGGYASHLVVRARATAVGAYEALVTNGDGAVVEGATSNVFAVVRGALVTAPDGSGVRPGVTRHFVLEAARRLGMPVELRALDAESIVSASEVFLTSSVREVLPVASIDRRVVGGGGFEVARALHSELRAQAGAPSLAPWL